ncbi:MAG: hypothetical protein Fur0018_05050 [Anaerolineales bacterium]
MMAMDKIYQQIREFVDALPILICALDKTGNFLVWNRECARVTGYSSAEIEHNPKALSYLIPDETYRQQILAEKDNRPTDRRWEWVITTRDGQRKIFSWSSIRDLSPGVHWLAGVDLTALPATPALLQQRHPGEQGLADRFAEKTPNSVLNQDAFAFLERLKRYICRAFKVEHIHIWLLDGHILRPHHAMFSSQQHDSKSEFALSDFPIFQKMLETQQAVFLSGADANEAWPLMPSDTRQPWVWLGAPMTAQGESLGILWLETSSKLRFAEFQRDFLEVLGQFAGQTLQNIRKELECNLLAQKQHLLNEATRHISSALDKPLIFQICAHFASALFQADAACFVWLDAQNQLSMVYRRNLPDDVDQDAPLSPDDLLWQVVKTSTSLLLTDYASHPRARPAWVQADIQSCLGVPLHGEGKTSGAFYLFRRKNAPVFTIDDLNNLEVLGWHTSVALENARAFYRERQRADELEALRDTLADFSIQLDLPSLMQAILQRATALLLASGGELGLYEAERGGLRVVASYNMGQAYEGTFIPIGQGIMGTVVQTNEVLFIPDYKTWHNRLSEYAHSKCSTVIAVPLHARGHLLGVISIVDQRANRVFDEGDIRILKTFASQAAIAVDNAQLFKAVNQRAEEAEILREVSLIVAGILDEGDAIRRILELIGRVLPCDGAIALLEEEGLLKVVGEHQWVKTFDFLGMAFPLDSATPYAEALRRQQPILVSDTAQYSPAWPNEAYADSVHSCMVAPLIAHNQVLGVLSTHSRMPGFFTSASLRLLSAFAAHVSIAIVNARLYKDAQYLAITDPLTQVYNRRYFFQVAQRELECSTRHQSPCSILMVDIDHFKNVNDTYGHQIGDIALQEVANACKHSVRDIDLLARYGGEEFIILLPETNAAGAWHVAQRLHHHISHAPIYAGRYEIKITVSVGVATREPKTMPLDTLINHADTALYQAKESGRNCVSQWKEAPPET